MKTLEKIVVFLCISVAASCILGILSVGVVLIAPLGSLAPIVQEILLGVFAVALISALAMTVIVLVLYGVCCLIDR
jgi:hypothetical protein